MGKLVVGLTRFLLLCAVVLVLPAVAASQPTQLTFTVDATSGWQNTGIALKANQTFSVEYVSGSWTVDYRFFDKVGLEGHPPKIDSQIYQGCKYIADWPYALLIGKVGEHGGRLLRLDREDVYVLEDGILFLSIHDKCLLDNAGSLTIRVLSAAALKTDITTFLADGVTPTSATGPGEALVYKITVTNTGLPAGTNTGVILSDPLPREIFAIIGTPRTDHGTCSTIGSSTNLACLLGRLAFGETATIYVTASISVRNPDGKPRPPGAFVNTVSVWSDQQTRATSASVKTLVTPAELTDAEALAFLDAVAGCVSLVPGIGSAAGLVWNMLGRDLATGQPKPYIDKLKQAAAIDSEELLGAIIKEGAKDVGLPDKVFSPAKNSAKCVLGFRAFLTR